MGDMNTKSLLENVQENDHFAAISVYKDNIKINSVWLGSNSRNVVGGEWSASRPGRFTPGKEPPVPILDTRLGGPQSRSGRHGEEKILDPTGTHKRQTHLLVRVDVT
jgi:hypothetical protein